MPKRKFVNNYLDQVYINYLIHFTAPFVLKTPSAFSKRNGGRAREAMRLETRSIPAMQLDQLFYELQCTATKGCLYTENVAQRHYKNPCFRKIEYLLTRLKNELTFQHNVASNINSQGTAWAIKDFTFVFSRIINAWIILRDYIYDGADEMNKLRGEFDPQFVQSFYDWQGSTLLMIKGLLSSIENLEIQNARSGGTDEKRVKQFYSSHIEQKEPLQREFLEKFQSELFSPNIAENSEEIQIRAHHGNLYFRAGVLKPLLIDNPPMQTSPNSSSSISSPSTPLSSEDGYSPNSSLSDSFNWLNYENDIANSPILNGGDENAERLFNRRMITKQRQQQHSMKDYHDHDGNTVSENVFERAFKKCLNENFNEAKTEKYKSAECMEIDNGKMIEIKVDEELLKTKYGSEYYKINYLLSEVFKIPKVECFSACISMIINNMNKGMYASVGDVLCDFKDLKQILIASNRDDAKMFINELEHVLQRKAFQ
jgi:hypothetical protein